MEASLRREHGEVHQPVLYLGLRLDLDPDQGYLLHKLFWPNLMILWEVGSVTRLGDLLHFGQLFKACGNNYFTQIAHILGNFCKGLKSFIFLLKSFIGQLL